MDYAGETILPGMFEELDPDGFDSIFTNIDSDGLCILSFFYLCPFKIVILPFGQILTALRFLSIQPNNIYHFN